MNAVFADTAFYVAIASPRDAVHDAAVSFVDRFNGRFITTDFVLVEVATFFASGKKRPTFVSLVRDLGSDSRTLVVPASRDLFERGAALFASRLDKGWSLTDCTSFVVMANLGLSEALTADRHFTQAGFRALLSTEG